MTDFSPDAPPTVRVSDLPDDAVILDVREQDEWDAGHAPRAIHVPLAELPSRLDDLPDTDETVPVVCRGGGRSARAVSWLLQQGFDVANVADGMKAWEQAGKQLVASGEESPRVI
ncbi:Rhodanese-related sulfurtransferase [Nostocoides japonicum T1-X7]|uniref:Rhodanese-related sulfurtransferase n=1 Tax=Nostocoides japonicum T1-X7 TaxID=1194083 RepID=A0A077M220_9MICO|nr:rhodanese-like domain-containing protein [Tetrasphaera japonica]CCH79102.1 Rhodanese-related sulfurtransferase [Tetrasphaera japonica T1-X7]